MLSTPSLRDDLLLALWGGDIANLTEEAQTQLLLVEPGALTPPILSSAALPPCPGSLPAAPLSQTCGLSTRELIEGLPTPQPQDVLVLGKPPLLRPGEGQPVCPECSPQINKD